MSAAAHPRPETPAGRPGRRSPYQGLIPYGEDDAPYFFGRDTTRAIVLDNLLAYRVSILYGPSGVGKSSLLRAGVVREVRDEARRRIARGQHAEYAALHYSSWSEDPVAGLQRAIHDGLAGLAPQLAEDLPAGGTLADTVRDASGRLDGALLIILDQFEEYFLYQDADGPFIAQLARMLARRDSAASVLISIREDALAKLDALAATLPDVLDNLVRIEHLDRDAARSAIIAPLQLWNREQAPPGDPVQIEPELVDAVLDGVRAGAVAGGEFEDAAAASREPETGIQTPYLQLVLTRLWDEERAAGSRVLRLSTLVRLGGAERIVATHVDNAIALLSPAEQAIAASVLRQLVRRSGTKIALPAADLAEDAGLPEPAVTAVLERLTREARILQAVGDSRYEIYHDALARPILQWRRHWQSGQDRLRQRRRNRIVAAVAAALMLTVIVVATLAVLAWLGRRDANRQAQDARAVALASASRDRVDTDPDVALLLGLAGLRERDRYETRNSMISAREAAGPEAAVGIIRGHTKTVNAAVFVEHGRAIVSAGEDGRLLVSDVATHRPLRRQFAGRRGPSILSLAVSPDGRRLAAGDEAGRVRLWDITARRLLRSVGARKINAGALAFSPDGRILAIGGQGSGIVLCDARTLQPVGEKLRTDDAYTLSLAFSPDGRTIAAVGTKYVVRRFSVRTRRRLPATFKEPGMQIVSVAFSPDGRTLATGGRRALLWDVGTGRAHPLRSAAGDPAAGARVSNVVFSPGGGQLAGAGEDGATRLWDVRTRAPLREAMRGPRGVLEGVAFSPDGRTIASFGADRRVWLLDPARPEALPHRRSVESIAFDRSGRTLATAAQDRLVRFWDVRSGGLVGTSRVVDPDALDNAFVLGAGTARLATSSQEGRLTVWDLRSPTAVATSLPSDPSDSSGYGLALSPAADALAASTGTSKITVWDIARRRRRGGPFGGRNGIVYALTFGLDARTLIAADETDARVWDLTTSPPSVVRRIRHAGGDTIAVSPDGQTLASVDRFGVIRLTRLAEGRPRGLLNPTEARVADVAFVPDGSMLIAGDEAHKIRIWDVADRRQLGAELEQQAPVNHVAVSPNGRAFAADGDGFSVRLFSHVIWRDKGELGREVCDLVGRGLSRAEWKQYAPGIAYRRVCDR